MSFIGKDTQSAPKLKEVKLSTEDMQDAFEQTIDVSHEICSLKKAEIIILSSSYYNY
jgi:serine/threonine-protein kinase RIO1